MSPERLRDDPLSGSGRAALARWAPLLAVAAVLVFFAPALQPSARFLHLDTGRLHEPTKRFIAEEFSKGRFPTWNPYNGLGAPVIAGGTDSLLHPFSLLLLVLPFEVAFKAWILCSYLLAALGGYAWCRALRLGPLASAAAGVALALSGFLVAQSNNVTYLTAYAALPWIFAAVHAFVSAGGPGRLALVGAASALCAAAGDPQAWGIALAAILPYAILAAAGPGERARAARRGAAAVLVAGVAAAPFMLPIASWIPHSSRSGPLLPIDVGRWNLHPVRLLELALPPVFHGAPGALPDPIFDAYLGNEWTHYPWVASLYAGTAAVALAAVGARRATRARWLLAAAAAFAWMATGPYLGFWQIARHVPVLSSFRYWEKVAIWPTLLIAVSAAHGIDALAADAGLARRAASWAGAVAGIVLVVAGVLWIQPSLVQRLVGDPAPEAGFVIAHATSALGHVALVCAAFSLACRAMARAPTRRFAPALLALLVVGDLVTVNHDAYVLSTAETWRTPPVAAPAKQADPLPRLVVPFPPFRDRWPELSTWDNVRRWGSRVLDSPWNVPARVGNFQPYAGMIERRMFRYLAARNFTPTIASGLWGVAYIVVPERPEAASQAGLPPPYRVAGVDPDLPAFLVEIPHRPRAYLAPMLVPTDEAGALRLALDPAFAASGGVAVEEKLPSGWEPAAGDARIVRDDPCRTELDVRADRPALLVLNDALAPGWSAAVDGVPTEIVPANYLARGVWVPPGSHRVAFEYQTPGLSVGLTLLALLAVALAGWKVVSVLPASRRGWFVQRKAPTCR